MDHPPDPTARVDLSPPEARALFTPEGVRLIARLVHTFRPRVEERLAARVERQRHLDAGGTLDFLPETAAIRAAEWRVTPPPPDLVDRRVEITGPCDAKMVINALNSGADVFMADLEDATSPTWRNLLQGQVNLRAAADGSLAWDAPDGRAYRLNPRTAVLCFRPRGWHLPEPHFEVDGAPSPGAIVDAALFVAGCARALVSRGSWPYLYLPKLESHLEARLWHDVLTALERAVDLPYGSIRVTVLIETLPAAFEMDEILYELRDRVVGLNCGRWDYIFSFIKARQADPAAVLPDRNTVTMTQPFLRAYSRLCIDTCHRRGAHAMGGMAAQIPIKDDPAANERALAAVRADKEREVSDGHDGTWVAHPGLVPIAREVFARAGPNQLERRWPEQRVTAADLLTAPAGACTVDGLRTNLRVAVTYTRSWLGGVGCVPIDHRMEDAATAEISRAQVWQWVRHGVRLDDGSVVDAERVHRELARLAAPGAEPAIALIEQLVLAPALAPFLTSAAYGQLHP
ncbi:MAG: malate synthase A [Myxococcota bacterium]